ncbi:hypothetical protein [Inquilinus sp. OTU3971]|uniref:hypothetical protein n=1 Tax=Inquilinus sp. OTU3971 TaxID=3043855 RepID=UPI00313BBCA1
MVTGSEATSTPGFEPLIEVAMTARAFSAYWAQCSYVATYAARAVSHNRTDSTLYSNLFSSAINELLELAYRSQHGEGVVACRVLRRGAVDRIEIEIPCAPAHGRFLLKAVEQLSGPGSEARYLNALTSDEGGCPEIGLLELAHDYGADISATAEDHEQVRLTVNLRLEDQVLV